MTHVAKQPDVNAARDAPTIEQVDGTSPLSLQLPVVPGVPGYERVRGMSTESVPGEYSVSTQCGGGSDR